MSRLGAVWRGLGADQRLAAGLALVVLLSTLLPWYAVTPARGPSRTLTAFGVYSFVEAGIFLVALAVLGLLFARGEGRTFRMPGGDGTVLLAAGAWIVFLVFFRQFDKPEVEGAIVGISWGIFVTILAGAGLGLVGAKLRGQHPGSSRGDPPPPVSSGSAPGGQ